MSTLRNNVRLTGFLGSNPEIKTYTENKNMARVSLATNERYRNMDGEWITETYWHQLVFWGKNAVFAQKNLMKGMEISVAGKLTSRSFVDKEGDTRYVTEVLVMETLLLQRKGLASTSPNGSPESLDINSEDGQAEDNIMEIEVLNEDHTFSEDDLEDDLDNEEI
jgi:single-strand DNA-binding protein